MKIETHTVTIPIDDYNELLTANDKADKKISDNKAHIEELSTRSREFVSALAFLEEKGLLDQFNDRISKKYKLQSVGVNKDYKQLIS